MGRCCLLFLRTRSAPRNWTRFAAQYLARGLPCERFTAALASRTSCITRGRGGWLDLPRGGLSPPILCQLPGALSFGSDVHTGLFSYAAKPGVRYPAAACTHGLKLSASSMNAISALQACGYLV